MATERTTVMTIRAGETVEGAGVRLRRVFGSTEEARRLDPFLLLDEFRSDDPDDYMAGFPWHPHRGIETVTYILAGQVQHRDSLGNKGTIGPGEVQWMTAGSGIVHEEMPVQSPGGIHGFQLWTNLPAKRKMMDPRYRDVPSQAIPAVPLDCGGTARLVAGSLSSTTGPVRDIVTEPLYADVTLAPGAVWTVDTPERHTVALYVFGGELAVGGSRPPSFGSEGTLLLTSSGTRMRVYAGPGGARCLLLAGQPLREPIAWQGPVVMNTEEELAQAFEEYRSGTFVRSGQQAVPSV